MNAGLVLMLSATPPLLADLDDALYVVALIIFAAVSAVVNWIKKRRESRPSRAAPSTTGNDEEIFDVFIPVEPPPVARPAPVVRPRRPPPPRPTPIAPPTLPVSATPVRIARVRPVERAPRPTHDSWHVRPAPGVDRMQGLNDLQRAIVMMEVLSPPVALRDEGRPE